MAAIVTIEALASPFGDSGRTELAMIGARGAIKRQASLDPTADDASDASDGDVSASDVRSSAEGKQDTADDSSSDQARDALAGGGEPSAADEVADFQGTAEKMAEERVGSPVADAAEAGQEAEAAASETGKEYANEVAKKAMREAREEIAKALHPNAASSQEQETSGHLTSGLMRRQVVDQSQQVMQAGHASSESGRLSSDADEGEDALEELEADASSKQDPDAESKDCDCAFTTETCFSLRRRNSCTQTECVHRRRGLCYRRRTR